MKSFIYINLYWTMIKDIAVNCIVINCIAINWTMIKDIAVNCIAINCTVLNYTVRFSPLSPMKLPSA